MTDIRLVECPHCGGDGGFDSPYDINRHDGSVLSHFYECRACDGNGEIEADVEMHPEDWDEKWFQEDEATHQTHQAQRRAAA